MIAIIIIGVLFALFLVFVFQKNKYNEDQIQLCKFPDDSYYFGVNMTEYDKTHPHEGFKNN